MLMCQGAGHVFRTLVLSASPSPAHSRYVSNGKLYCLFVRLSSGQKLTAEGNVVELFVKRVTEFQFRLKSDSNPGHFA